MTVAAPFPIFPGRVACSKSSISSACAPPSGRYHICHICPPIRLPPETLPRRAACLSSKLTKSTTGRDKALIDPYDYEGNSALSAKFKRRENFRAGCILVRPRICQEVRNPARRLCPVRGFGESAIGRTSPSGPLFPDPSANTVTIK